MKKITSQYLSAVVAVLLLCSGCTHTCKDPMSLTYEQGLGNKYPLSQPSDCVYSSLVWYILTTDSVYKNDSTILPLQIRFDNAVIGTIYKAAVSPGSICDDTLLPASTYIIKTLTDNKEHSWAAIDSATGVVLFNDTIRTSPYYPCIPISLK